MCKLDLPPPKLGAIYRRCVGSGPDRWHSSSWRLVVLFSADYFAIFRLLVLAYFSCGERAYPFIHVLAISRSTYRQPLVPVNDARRNNNRLSIKNAKFPERASSERMLWHCLLMLTCLSHEHMDGHGHPRNRNCSITAVTNLSAEHGEAHTVLLN